MKQPKVVLRGAIVLYFVIGLEILIMISPAAGFFYAVFNPFLLSLAKSPATRWLTAFYLPHMVLPPDLFLKIIRVAGSFLFVTGSLVFLLCASQVYHKFARKGVALGGCTPGSGTRSTWGWAWPGSACPSCGPGSW